VVPEDLHGIDVSVVGAELMIHFSDRLTASGQRLNFRAFHEMTDFGDATARHPASRAGSLSVEPKQ
jgi:hypothetical protein